MSTHLLGTADATSTAPASAFFARWTDHDSWSEWSPDTSWVRLHGPVAQGTRGVLKPVGGPRTTFAIDALTPDREYTDVSRFPGAVLRFQHLVAPRPDGGSDLHVSVTLSGPLAGLWAKVLGASFAQSVPADLERLVALAEAVPAAAGR